MNNKAVLIIFLLGIVSIGSIAGCGSLNKSTDTSSSQASIIINNGIASLRLPKSTSTTFESLVKDGNGNVLSNISVSWEVSGEIGSIDELGVFTAQTPGLGTIKARYLDLQAILSVEVYASTILEAFGDIYDNFLYIERIPVKYNSLSGELLEAALLADYGSTEGFVGALADPYTRCYSAGNDPADAVLSPGSYGGVGIYLKKINARLAIYYPIPGQPAAQAGMSKGDEITHVNGATVTGLTTNEAANLIRGSVGSLVQIDVLRNGLPLTFQITRKVISPKSVYGELINGNMAYIRVLTFSSDVTYDFEQAFNQISAECNGLIIDLRDNGGGYVSGALSLSSLFVRAGDMIMRVNYKNSQEDEAAYDCDKISMPVVLILNESSASATEIFAAALLENGLATSVGTRSYGKGLMQIRTRLSDDSHLYITTAEFFTPNHRVINDVGITPDVITSWPADEYFAGNDKQLAAAIVELNRKTSAGASSVRGYGSIRLLARKPSRTDKLIDRPINNVSM